MKSWLSERVHPYYFVVFFSIGIILGVVLSVFLASNWLPANWLLAASGALVVVSIIKLRRFMLASILLAGILLGAWRGGAELLKVQDYQSFYGKSVVVHGTIVDDVTYKDDGISYKLRDVNIENQNLSGEIWAKSNMSQKLNRSDTVTSKGFLLEGFGSFSASLVRAEIISIEPTSRNDIGLQAREKFAASTENTIPEPERNLGLGYLLGMKTALPEELAAQIQLLGLTHVVVASGYNLTILVVFGRRLFANISKYLSALTGGIMIFGFILITGFSPSMSRAGLVAGLALLAWYYGRKIHPIVLILVAAAATLLIRPSYIWGDIGWYLSFAAFFGILVLAPLIHHYFWGIDRKPSIIRELFVATLSAQLMTLPIILHSFGSYSVYSLLANILILPVVPLSMLATFIAGVAGFINQNLGEILSFPAIFLLRYCIVVIEKLSGLPKASNDIELGLSGLFVGYGLLLSLTIVLMIKTKHNFLKDKTIVD